MEDKPKYELTILMPCRNEEATVGICIDAARAYLDENGINGEILIADNGSSDKSVSVAAAHGARVISVKKPGYGRALRAGFLASRGSVVIMADCDTTYDFSETGRLYHLLADGTYDMVIGDRFSGGIEKGAMPVSHIIGVKALSFLGRKRFDTNIKDFHCGFRGITRKALTEIKNRKLSEIDKNNRKELPGCDLTANCSGFRTTGMEFATEMIAAAVKNNLRIGQVPVKLKKCRASRQSKLRTVRDGLRHLIYIIKS
jgi:Glycosyltransferases involved in cell wall biogenesis